MVYSSKTRSRTTRRTRKMSKKNKRINDFYQIQKMRIEDVYHFGRFTKLQYAARRKLEFDAQIAAYLAGIEYARLNEIGYDAPEFTPTNVTYDDYRKSQTKHPRYSEPETTNPWYISGLGEWDQLYGDLSA